MRRRKDKTAELIERTWYKLASGVQVNIMDIGAIFDGAKAEMAEGATVEEAVQTMISKYRKN